MSIASVEEGWRETRLATVQRANHEPWDRRLWSAGLRCLNRRLNRGRLRIVLYHGVCRDDERRSSWVPSHYLTQSALDDQLTLLRRSGSVIDLREAAELLASGRSWREPLFAVTFDDAPANLLQLAAPVLAAHGVAATIFACTDRLEDGDLLAEDAHRALAARQADAVETEHPMDTTALEPCVRESLRCMRWAEAMEMVRAGHWLGAHTRTHANLAQTDAARRREEIEGSVRAIRERLNTSEVPFAYPYGQRRNFGPQDEALLCELEVPLVCTTIAGGNGASANRFELRRDCLGLFHTRLTFAAEILGLADHRRRAGEEPVTCW